MAKVSIIIPSRNEIFLAKTVEDLYAHAGGEIEVIVILDGYWPNPPLSDRPGLTIIHNPVAKGLRAANNAGAHLARGEYLLKVDAHCMFAEGFDIALAKDCADNEIVIPRRYSLDAEAWAIKPGRPVVDYHYLTCPLTNPDGFSMHGQWWRERDRERAGVLIDETPSFQGSCWFMTRKHFLEHLGGMSEEGYGTFCQEPQELGNKTWLGPWDGRVLVNKNTWYAHLHKGKQYGRGYHQSKREIIAGHTWAGEYWMYDRWKGRVKNFDWLIDRFPGMPTWPEDWRDRLANR